MKLKIALAAVAMLVASSGANAQQWTNIDSSPYNPINSQFNPDNAPFNPRNSPYNPDNSAYNPSSTNGVYDNWGNRIGYEVQAPSGVTNIYSNDGRRMGYVPAPQR